MASCDSDFPHLVIAAVYFRATCCDILAPSLHIMTKQGARFQNFVSDSGESRSGGQV